MPSSCQARPTSSGEVRCVACRRVWDADDGLTVCPRANDEVRGVITAPPLVPAAEPYRSALAPDPFARRI
jgi:hypothetical protein